MIDHFGLFRPGHSPALHGHVRGKRGEHGQLAGEGLGAGHADFRSGMGWQQQVRLARHRAGRHVDHHGDGLPRRLAMAQRRQRIGGFSTLRDEQRQAARFKHRIAIAELARDIDVDRQAGELFKPVLRDHPGVIAGPAGNNGHPVDGRKVEIELRQGHRLIDLTDRAGECLRHHGRLLEDLLLHEVAVIALLDRRGGGARGGNLEGDRLIVLVIDPRAIAGYDNPIPLIQIGDLLGQRRKRQGV